MDKFVVTHIRAISGSMKIVKSLTNKNDIQIENRKENLLKNDINTKVERKNKYFDEHKIKKFKRVITEVSHDDMVKNISWKNEDIDEGNRRT